MDRRTSAPKSAERWFAQFADEIQPLSSTCVSRPLARESRRMPFALREMLFGKRRHWRVLLTIRGDDVLVMGIRHASQNDATLDDLMDAGSE